MPLVLDTLMKLAKLINFQRLREEVVKYFISDLREN